MLPEHRVETDLVEGTGLKSSADAIDTGRIVERRGDHRWHRLTGSGHGDLVGGERLHRQRGVWLSAERAVGTEDDLKVVDPGFGEEEAGRVVAKQVGVLMVGVDVADVIVLDHMPFHLDPVDFLTVLQNQDFDRPVVGGKGHVGLVTIAIVGGDNGDRDSLGLAGCQHPIRREQRHHLGGDQRLPAGRKKARRRAESQSRRSDCGPRAGEEPSSADRSGGCGH